MDGECSVMRELVIEKATKRAYDELAGWHYRGRNIGPCTAVFGARHRGERRWAGVIVYGMAAIGSEMRAKAMATIGCEGPLDEKSIRERIDWLNANVRCISRVIVEPRYRGIGLGVRLVRETLPLAGVPVVEAIAAMGEVNPFFEKAGMMRFGAGSSEGRERMARALRDVGIEPPLFIDSREVHMRLNRLPGKLRRIIDAEMRFFLKAYVKRRGMYHCIERTRYVLARMGTKPVYYLWQKQVVASS